MQHDPTGDGMAFDADRAFDADGATARMRRNERIVRAGFWRKFIRQAGRLPFAEDLLAAYYCALDQQTPLKVRAMLFAALAYFIMPFDGVADILPIVGFADDAAVLTAALKLVVDSIRPEHRAAAREKLSK